MLNILFIFSFVAIALGSLPWWYRAIKQFRKREPILLGTERIESPLGLVDVSVMFLIWFVGQLAGLTLAEKLSPIVTTAMEASGSSLEEIEAHKLALMAGVSGVCQIAFTAAGIFVIWFRYGNWEIFGLRKPYIRRDILTGLVAFLMVIPGILLLQNVLTQFVEYEHATLELLQQNRSIFTLVCTWFAAVIAAPICEEIFFRGILQSWLQRFGKSGEEFVSGGWSDQTRNLSTTPRRNANPCSTETSSTKTKIVVSSEFGSPPRSKFDPHSWAPIVISSVVFGMVHIGQGAAPIPLFVFGLALGYLYRQTASVLPCIVLHMGLNGFSMFWFTMQMLYPEAASP